MYLIKRGGGGRAGRTNDLRLQPWDISSQVNRLTGVSWSPTAETCLHTDLLKQEG